MANEIIQKSSSKKDYRFIYSKRKNKRIQENDKTNEGISNKTKTGNRICK